MKMIKMFGILVVGTVLITGCGSNTDNAAKAADKKPSLDLSVDVSGNTATVKFNTDLMNSAELFGKERKAGEGHIHMSLDDGEYAMLSENKAVLPNLAPGKHKVKVSLHNNDHTPYDVSKTIDFEVK
jgi:Family of unknown function (DUF6130)